MPYIKHLKKAFCVARYKLFIVTFKEDFPFRIVQRSSEEWQASCYCAKKKGISKLLSYFKRNEQWFHTRTGWNEEGREIIQ